MGRGIKDLGESVSVKDFWLALCVRGCESGSVHTGVGAELKALHMILCVRLY
jgi:hypothetical protein